MKCQTHIFLSLCFIQALGIAITIIIMVFVFFSFFLPFYATFSFDSLSMRIKMFSLYK